MAGAAAVVAVMSRASAATRHFVWTLAIAGLLLLPIFTAALPAWEVAVPILPSAVLEPIDAPRDAGVAASIPAAPADAHERRRSRPNRSADRRERAVGRCWRPLVYVLGLLALLVRTARAAADGATHRA